MHATAARLYYAALRAHPRLQALSPAELQRPLQPGQWSPQEIIGHLIDSAANNHQRFVRAQLGLTDISPYRYEQDEWVRTQHHAAADWPSLLSLWLSYQMHLAHVIAHIPEHLADTLLQRSMEEEVTLRWLAEDYVRHLRHHVAQVLPPGPIEPPASPPGVPPFWLLPLSAEHAPLVRYLGRATYAPYYPHCWKPGGLDWYMEHCFGQAALHLDFSDPNIRYWVAADEQDEIIGLLKLGLQRPIPGSDDPNALYLEKIYLLPDHFGRGWGQHLINCICDFARA
ncbi:MAG TPA: GNAT family N-acetyltransferase, partial [Saprospiraceae bacterium]|nr:GNAT family N-acetyltransferase [Saprospiraceae bacterium]